MAFFFCTFRVSQRGCTPPPPLEEEYRRLYAQTEKSRQPSAWTLYLLRNAYMYMKIICLIHLMVSILDVVYIFSGTAYITSLFTCTYDKETVKDPIWKIIEKVVKVLNYGSHGFFPYPYIFSYTEYYLQFEDSYCGTAGIFLIPWEDLANFAGNCIWLMVSALRFETVMTKDIATFKLIYVTDIVKILLEIYIFRHELANSSDYNFTKIILNTLLLIAVIYLEYIYICKLKSDSEVIRSKCLAVRLQLRLRRKLTEEEKDFEETMKYIPESMVHEILDV